MTNQKYAGVKSVVWYCCQYGVPLLCDVSLGEEGRRGVGGKERKKERERERERGRTIRGKIGRGQMRGRKKRDDCKEGVKEIDNLLK